MKQKQPRYEDGRVDRFTSKHGTHSNSQAQHRSHHQREGAVIIKSRDRFDCAANGIIGILQVSEVRMYLYAKEPSAKVPLNKLFEQAEKA